jgi:hypothetical protein
MNQWKGAATGLRGTAMGWRNRFRVILWLAAVIGAYGQESGTIRTVPSASGVVADRRAFVLQAIEGRTLVVRVYQNLYVDPEKCVKVGVPARGGQMQLTAIKKAHPSASPLSHIFFQASDQTDETVARALEGLVFLFPYPDQIEQPLQLFSAINNKPIDPYWTFLDAQGIPMAGASVEIRITASSFGSSLFGSPADEGFQDSYGKYSSSIYVGQSILDEKGRIKRIISGAGTFIFKVQHPRYGIASVLKMGEIGDAGIYVVPLAPKDSPVAAQSIQGTVVDSKGQPVKGAHASFKHMNPPRAKPSGVPISGSMRFNWGAFTDEKGKFSFCEPLISEEPLSVIPAPAKGPFQIEILPPKSANLRRVSMQNVLVNSAEGPPTYTLTPMDATTAYHTFAFKYPDREITSPDELDRIRLTLDRDRRQWVKLSYADFKEGFRLPTGALRAEILREDRSQYAFPVIEIGANSPAHLIFQMPATVTYRGKVIDESTGRPMAGVYVVATPIRGDADSWTAQQWQDLQNRAEQYARDDSLGLVQYDAYGNRSRVYVTDANGSYEAHLMPGTGNLIPDFYALAPGYAFGSTGTLSTLRISGKFTSDFGGRLAGLSPSPPPDTNGIVALPVIRLVPSERVYFPRIIFEDENGRAIDQKSLSSVTIIIGTKGVSGSMSLDSLLQRKAIDPAAYSATARWDDKICYFKTVDLTKEKPETVVFKLQRSHALRVTYTGQVVDGITGTPIWGAIVATGMPSIYGDGSRVEPQQWNVLKELGSNPDPSSQAMAPFAKMFALSSNVMNNFVCAVTDQEGRFHLTVEQDNKSAYDLIALANGFLGVRQSLVKAGTKDIEKYRTGQNGETIMPLFRMPPAATIQFHPAIPNTEITDSGTQRVRLQWIVAPEDAWRWFPDMQTSIENSYGMRIMSPGYLAPNKDQTANIPAGVKLTLKVMPNTSRESFKPIVFGPLKLDRGEVKTVGRIE